ncbi:MAG: hypothetical protein JW725_01310 [Candidatus Babeliaceae bacterium]|nr:hypothetical protein [Candidatus Babeliaceae bacterium]
MRTLVNCTLFLTLFSALLQGNNPPPQQPQLPAEGQGYASETAFAEYQKTVSKQIQPLTQALFNKLWKKPIDKKIKQKYEKWLELVNDDLLMILCPLIGEKKKQIDRSKGSPYVMLVEKYGQGATCSQLSEKLFELLKQMPRIHEKPQLAKRLAARPGLFRLCAKEIEKTHAKDAKAITDALIEGASGEVQEEIERGVPRTFVDYQKDFEAALRADKERASLENLDKARTAYRKIRQEQESKRLQYENNLKKAKDENQKMRWREDIVGVDKKLKDFKARYENMRQEYATALNEKIKRLISLAAFSDAEKFLGVGRQKGKQNPDILSLDQDVHGLRRTYAELVKGKAPASGFWSNAWEKTTGMLGGAWDWMKGTFPLLGETEEAAIEKSWKAYRPEAEKRLIKYAEEFIYLAVAMLPEGIPLIGSFTDDPSVWGKYGSRDLVSNLERVREVLLGLKLGIEEDAIYRFGKSRAEEALDYICGIMQDPSGKRSYKNLEDYLKAHGIKLYKKYAKEMKEGLVHIKAYESRQAEIRGEEAMEHLAWALHAIATDA